MNSASAQYAVGEWLVDTGAATDIGTVRQRNEDVWRAVELADGVALCLADGMGGHPGGAEAAAAAVEGAAELLRARRLETGILAAAVQAADEGVRRVAERIEGRPGSTLLIAAISGPAAVVANVGDSRAYRVRGGREERITIDHSVPGDMVRSGDLEESELRSHPRRNALTRWVQGVGVDPEIFPLQCADGDVLVLCSDGVWEPLRDSDFATLSRGESAQGAALSLCEAALAAGSLDNVTAVVATIRRRRVRRRPVSQSADPRLPRRRSPHVAGR
ncbi:MAG: PP2C family protein-serine/threonine phosphatase [Candidatus Dormibacteria bacterium]